jgi:hypothetical protein
LLIADHVKLRNQLTFSYKGDTAMIPIRDVFTKMRIAFPLKSKDATDTGEAFGQFLGYRKGKALYSDNSKELAKVARDKGFLHPTSTSYRPTSNGEAESDVAAVLNGTRTCLHGGGAPLDLWCEACQY